MYGQYIIKIKDQAEWVETSNEPLSSMEEVFDWYAKTARPNPVKLSKERFEELSSREWRLRNPVGDCEMVVLKLIDSRPDNNNDSGDQG